MTGNTISNIGDPSTDFSATGGLTLNDDLIVDVAASIGTGVAAVSGTRLTLPVENDPITPTLSFGVGNAGIYAESSSNLNYAILGVAHWRMGRSGAIGQFHGMVSSAPMLRNATPSRTNPTIHIRRNNTSSGFGGLDNEISMDISGAEMLRVAAAGTTVVAGALDLVLRPMTFTEQATVPGGAPAAGTLTHWVRNDTPSASFVTNDVGEDVPTGNHVLQTQYSEVTVDTTYSPVIAGTFADLLTVNITAAGANDLIIQSHVSASNPNANRDFQTRILVDGTPIGGSGSELRTGGIASTVSMIRKTSVAAGARVVKLQWTTTGTVNCRPVTLSDDESASLMVQEVR
jgi:hypothetical protein